MELPSPRDDDARARFRQHVADQFRCAADRAGLPVGITDDGERIVLHFDEPFADGGVPRFVIIFTHDEAADPRYGLTLSAETEEGSTTLLTLRWHDEPGPTEERALARQLAELESRFRLAAAQAGRMPARLRPLAPVERPPRVLIDATERPKSVSDGDERPLRALSDADLQVQRASLSEMLISGLLQAMQRDLAEAESHFIGPGAAATARGRFTRGMEWAMLTTAYGVEAQTNQIAVSSFLGSAAASWLYGLVGPVLIAGLASLTKSRAGRGAAYALMVAWALAMTTITASEPGFLDRAQGIFPKQPAVLTHEQAIATARVRKQATDTELKRLTAPPKDTTSSLASAKKRWQATEMMRAANQEREAWAKDIAQARKAATEAAVALSDEELRLRTAILNDPSRDWAWWTLFAFFGVINLAAPLSISRLLDRWQADYSGAAASARDRHRMKSMVALLRGSRSAQKAHAMQLIPALLDRLKRDGVQPDAIAALDLADISDKAADRFDRGVNGKRARRSFLGLRRLAQGPG